MLTSHIIIILSIGFIAGILNTMAGGGSLLTLPALILLGMPAHVANATNRVGVLAQCIFSYYRFHSSSDLGPPLPKALYLYTFLGAIFGSILSLYIPEEIFEKTLGFLMLIIFIVTITKPKLLDVAPKAKTITDTKLKNLDKVILFIIGSYGGFLQAGVGLTLLFFLTSRLKYSMAQANAHKLNIITWFTIPVIAIYATSDLILWYQGLVLALGTSLGGWVGVHLSLRWGNIAARSVLTVMVLGAAIKYLI